MIGSGLRGVGARQADFRKNEQMTGDGPTFDEEIYALARALAQDARDSKTEIQDKIKIFKELREFHAVLTKGDDKSDKEPSRRPTTMAGMRDKIARLSVVPERGEPEDDSA